MTIPTNVSRETSGLPPASATTVVELSDGDRFALRIAPCGDEAPSIFGPTSHMPE